MGMYECDCCHFITNQHANYLRHLNTSKHKVIFNGLTLTTKPKEFVCEYCEQKFSFKQSMYKHIKYRCTKNKDEDVIELVRLMNLKLQQKDTQLESQQKQINTQTKQIEKLMGKLEINNSFNTNITLLAYKDTDVSHLTERDYVCCIKHVNFCVKKLIEQIHFNPEKPENMNIYISNLKDKYMMLYNGKNWNITNKKELDCIYDDKEMMLDQWMDEQHKYPELKEKFDRYINNKEKDDTLNMIKEEIKLMMYNNKNLIEN